MPTSSHDALLRIYELIFELVESLGKPKLRKAWRQDFETSVAGDPAGRAHLADIESELAGLDAIAWTHLRQEITSQINLRDPAQGWRQAVDLLNQAKAYRYLVKRGCTDIEFLPKSSGAKTPDLQARAATVFVLCEVKTIYISHIGADGRLPHPFFKKFTSRLIDAEKQMASFNADPGTRRIIYVVLHVADNLHENIAGCMEQIRALVRTLPASETEIVFDVTTAFSAPAG